MYLKVIYLYEKYLDKYKTVYFLSKSHETALSIFTEFKEIVYI